MLTRLLQDSGFGALGVRTTGLALGQIRTVRERSSSAGTPEASHEVYAGWRTMAKSLFHRSGFGEYVQIVATADV